MNKDTLTGILGALVLVAAMTGVFFYERGQFSEYNVEWAAGEATTTNLDGNPLDHGADRTHTVNVTLNEALVAGVTIDVRWSENQGDEFGLEVTAPDGSSKRERGTGGRLTLMVPVQDAPPATTVADRDRDAALEQAWSGINETAREAGQGDWILQVTLHDAMRENEVPVLDPEPGDNSYTITFTRSTWEPVMD